MEPPPAPSGTCPICLDRPNNVIVPCCRQGICTICVRPNENCPYCRAEPPAPMCTLCQDARGIIRSLCCDDLLCDRCWFIPCHQCDPVYSARAARRRSDHPLCRTCVRRPAPLQGHCPCQRHICYHCAESSPICQHCGKDHGHCFIPNILIAWLAYIYWRAISSYSVELVDHWFAWNVIWGLAALREAPGRFGVPWPLLLLVLGFTPIIGLIRFIVYVYQHHGSSAP